MLDTIFEEVGEMEIDDKSVLDEIMKRVKKYNFIPPEMENPLSEEILKAYREFLAEKK